MHSHHTILKLTDISFTYDGREAPVIDGLHLDLRHGDQLGLIGSNGSGKTTLFHIIMGLLKPTSGTIEFMGKAATDEKDFRAIRKRVGLLFQDADDQLFSPTVLEDVAFGPLNLGKSLGEAKAIAQETLESLGLKGFEDRITYKLSGGEKRLVSLATVLAMKPEVLLLDEPTTGLDEATEKRLIEILKELDMTHLLVSHNLDFLAEVTHQITAIVDGRLSWDDALIPHTHVHTHKHGKFAHEHR
jgi:cobalt/nickel transport system ATP-binding protein